LITPDFEAEDLPPQAPWGILSCECACAGLTKSRDHFALVASLNGLAPIFSGRSPQCASVDFFRPDDFL
jgi:hypothetical protein